MRDYGSLRLRAEIGIGEKPCRSAEGGGLQEVIGLSKARWGEGCTSISLGHRLC